MKGCFLLSLLFAGCLAGANAEVFAPGSFDHEGIHEAATVQDCLWLDGYSDVYTAPVAEGVIPAGASEVSLSVLTAFPSAPLMKIDQPVDDLALIAGNIDEEAKTGLGLYIDQKGHAAVKAFTGGWPVQAVASTALEPSAWHRLTATFDGPAGELKLYDNGTEIASSRCMAAFDGAGTASTLRVGRDRREELAAGLFYLNAYCGLVGDVELKAEIPSEIPTVVPSQAPNLWTSPAYVASHPWRPAFHGAPSSAWTNESHALLHHDGQWHLFFQKNANGPYWGHLQWGHITSDDLLTWTEQPIALLTDQPYDVKGCWSGCAFQEAFDGEPELYYTAVDYAKATIARAVPSTADLVKWQKDAAPVINGRPAGLSDDFRDCMVFVNPADNQKYMIVGTSKDNIGACTLHRYTPETGSWSNDGATFFRGTSKARDGRFWEMPTLNRIGSRWLFTVTPLETSEGVHTLYWIGQINPDGTFAPDFDAPRRLDGMSREGFGLLSPSVATLADGNSAVALGIVPDKLPSQENAQMGWAHSYSLPRLLTINADGELLQSPHPTAETLRKGEIALCEELTPTTDGRVELAGRWNRQGVDRCGFSLFGGDVKVAYSRASNSVEVDMTALPRTKNDAGTYDGVYRASLDTADLLDEEVEMRVFVDGSVMDIFVNGRHGYSLRLFPQEGVNTSVATFSEGTQPQAVELKAYNLEAPTAAGLQEIFAEPSPLGEETYYTPAGLPAGACPQGHGIYISSRGRKIAL